MLRINKLTDYAIVLLTHMAGFPLGTVVPIQTASCATRVPAPTLAKIAKQLTRGGLLESKRGASGGYRLARSPGDIPLLDVLTIMEGPVALTECAEPHATCADVDHCTLPPHWQVITSAVQNALGQVTLAALTTAPPPLEGPHEH